ncbi:hypothetical protein F4821DRAFT_251275, partial [Hypoxylon rubiginosum]
MALTMYAYLCYGTLCSSSVALMPWKFQGLCDPPPLFWILGLPSLLVTIMHLWLVSCSRLDLYPHHGI